MALPGILQRLFDHMAEPCHAIKGFDGVKVYLDKDGALRIDPYEICWMWYPIALANPRAGFYAPTGAVIANAPTVVPRAWEYLQTAEGQTLCTTLAAWNAEYNDAKWGGLQGACAKYVIDTAAKTIKLPDVRGLVMEQAGFDSLSVGGVKADQMQGHWHTVAGGLIIYVSGSHEPVMYGGAGRPGDATSSWQARAQVSDGVNGTPRIGGYTAPRRCGVNVCVYLGTA